MTPTRYDVPSRVLHWLMAALIIAAFAAAFIQEEMPRGEARALVLSLHIFGGGLILALALGRLGWAGLRAAPPSAEGSGLLAAAARWTHRALYALMLAAPLAGWWLYSVRGRPSALFGVTFPMVAEKSDAWRGMASEMHEALAWALVGLAAVHALAALYHHFVLRDGLMSRMGGGAGVHS